MHGRDLRWQAQKKRYKMFATQVNVVYCLLKMPINIYMKTGKKLFSKGLFLHSLFQFPGHLFS